MDIPNVFRDFDADPDDPASNDFIWTDPLITSLVNAKVEPFTWTGNSKNTGSAEWNSI